MPDITDQNPDRTPSLLPEDRPGPARRRSVRSTPGDDDFQVHTFDTGNLEAAPLIRQPAAAPELAASPPAVAPAARRAPMLTGAARRAVRRRTMQPPPKPSNPWLLTLRTVLLVVMTAVLVSTIFSLWTRPTFFSDEFREGLNQVQATQHILNIEPSPLPTETREIRVGIVAGHSGRPQDPNFAADPGAVCDDGLTELSINQAVAGEVVKALGREGYTVDLLNEFDTRLEGYQADVLVSIHTNSCADYGPGGTGFAVASAVARQSTRGADEYLLNCLISQYGKTTGLPQHTGLTYDMTEYHTFSEVSLDTPTAIIELGFMRNDRGMLTGQQPILAQGVANGIRCFLRPDLYAGTVSPAQ